MDKKLMKEYNNLYDGLFDVPNANVTAIENGAQISDEVRVRDLMNDLRKFYNIVEKNLKANQKKEFKSAVKDYSQYCKKDEKEIDFSIIDMNRKTNNYENEGTKRRAI